jgi:hypothetical protein
MRILAPRSGHSSQPFLDTNGRNARCHSTVAECRLRKKEPSDLGVMNHASVDDLGRGIRLGQLLSLLRMSCQTNNEHPPAFKQMYVGNFSFG